MMADSDASRDRYAMLMVAIVCQGATVAATWNLWQVRDQPVALPVLPDLPPIPFGWAMLASLILATLVPRFGIVVHWLVLIAACGWDQFRLEPQFFGLAVLMLVFYADVGTRMVRWYLVAMWTWAAIHKFLSPEWSGYVSWQMLDQSGIPADQLHVVFGIAVAATELALGMFAIFRPHWAARLGVAVHLGIAITLSPLLTGMNVSVIPWNLAIATVGYWSLMRLERPTQASFHAAPWWERSMATALLLIPVGFYPGWVDRCFCHVLYSGNLPRGLITTQHGTEEVDPYPSLGVPFPQERRLFQQYFSTTAENGDKLHLADPRSSLADQYFVMRDSVAHEIDAIEFFRPRADRQEPAENNAAKNYAGDSNVGETRTGGTGEVAGVAIDDRRSLFALSQAGVKMLKKSQHSPVYAIAFTPQNFDRRLLACLKGLPNLQQIQLSGTDIRDADLPELGSLYQLSGLGLSGTRVTERGLDQLNHLVNLQYIETDATSARSGGEND